MRFKRSRVTKSYSYRYGVGCSVGPPGDPLVEAGCAIVSSRYSGRATSWIFSRSVMSTERYVVNATFVPPSPDNPMTYSPRPLGKPDALWTDRHRRADPAPPLPKKSPQPGEHWHEPPPRRWR
jgi:hypothetical protein